MRALRPSLVAALVGIVFLSSVPLAHAAFADRPATTAVFSTASLSPASNLTVQKRCSSLLGLFLSGSLDLAWTPSSTAWASGQRVVVTDGGGAEIAAQDLSASATSMTVSLSGSGGTYTSTVHATYSGWTSPAVSATTTGC